MALTSSKVDRDFKRYRDAGSDLTKVAVSIESESDSLLFEQASSSILYLATAPYGSLPDEPKWRIQKIDTSSGVSIKNASQYSDQVWDDRASLTYV